MTYTKPAKCDGCGGECNNELQCICCGNIDKDFIKLIFPEKNIETCYIKIYNKLLDGTITKKDEEILLYYLKHDMIQENSFADALIIIDKIQYKKLNISYEVFKEIFCFSIKKFMKNIVGNKIKNYNPRCTIFNLNEEISGGAIENISVLIDEEDFKNFYYNGNINILITMYHEVQHIIQNTNIKLGIFNEDLLLQLKEQIIRKYEFKTYKTNTYYENNYNNISYEVDARIKSVQYVINFLSYFNLSLNDSYLEYLKNTYIGNYDLVNRTVIINGEKTQSTINDVFDKIIINMPEYLELYPQLKLEYINDNGVIRRKTKEELIASADAISDNKDFKNEDLNYILKLIDTKQKTTNH